MISTEEWNIPSPEWARGWGALYRINANSISVFAHRNGKSVFVQ